MSAVTERVLAEVAAFKLSGKSPRTERFELRLSPEELAELRRRAEASGLSVSSFARGRVLDERPRNPP